MYDIIDKTGNTFTVATETENGSQVVLIVSIDKADRSVGIMNDYIEIEEYFFKMADGTLLEINNRRLKRTLGPYDHFTCQFDEGDIHEEIYRYMEYLSAPDYFHEGE